MKSKRFTKLGRDVSFVFYFYPPQKSGVVSEGTWVSYYQASVTIYRV